MNQQTRTIVFYIAAILVLAGAFLHFYQWMFAPYLFAVGAAGLAVSYFTLSTKDMDFRTKRLHNFNVIAGILMILASGLMFANKKEWVLCLTIAALLQLYSAFVTPRKKEGE